MDAEAKSNNEAKSYDETKTILTSFNEEKVTCKILPVFLLISIQILLAVTIYCYLIK